MIEKKSNQLYNELLKQKSIPELEHEQELSTENLLELAKHLDRVVESYTSSKPIHFKRVTGTTMLRKMVIFVRTACTKAGEGRNRQLMINARWEQQKTYVREQLLGEKTGELYR